VKKIIKESGIRDINKLRKEFDKVIIVFHQDTDGVCSALGMKHYFENYGFKVIDAHVIQYGDKEWSLKKSDPNDKVLYCLCDFAHGKPMFQVHLDHHDRQAGAEDTKSTSFRQSRSNVETISQIVSPKELFPSSDILLISTVDSADFAKHDITADEVVNYLFRFDKEKSLQRNKMLLGLVINKLILAFKNKPGFLEGLVMNSEPSLMSILTNIKEWMKKTNAVKPELLQKNADEYKTSMQNYPNVENNIIFQYGGGSMFKPGSYDRYTPFRNNPEADFLIMAWPLGLVQASCNPFKKERELKGVNLGEIAQEVLSKWEDQLKTKEIPLSTIKWVSETSVGPESVGFTFKDFKALYGDKFKSVEGGDKALRHIGQMMEVPFSELPEEHRQMLDKISINAWDLIQSNSGGHKCITNISGLNYLGRGTRPPQEGKRFGDPSEDSPAVKFTKMIATRFRNLLKEKIDKNK
jgi:hypothetical protein